MSSGVSIDPQLRRRLRAFAASIGVITALIVPSLYFYASFDSLDKNADTILSVAADRVSQVVFEQPEMWQFLDERLVGVLEGIQEDIRYASRFEVFDENGNLIVSTSSIRDYALLQKKTDIGDLASPSGSIVFYVDILLIWIDTGLWLVLGVILGGASYYTLQVFPMRELIIAQTKLTDLNKNLSDLVDERTKDLRQEIQVRQLVVEDLIEAKDQAERASRAKSDFLSSMSHELRTPMNSILGFAQLIARAPEESRVSEHQTRIDLILNSGSHLMSMIDQLLDMSRIETDNFDATLKDVDVSLLINECIKLSEPLIDGRAIRLNVECSSENKVFVRADENQLRQVFMNILSNAIKYNSDPGVITISNECLENETIRIIVSDTGVGIPEDKLFKLFTPFDRLGHEASNIQGTGLGLSITKRLVEKMGGEIGVHSDVGIGSQFWIELPIVKHAGSVSS